MPKPTGPRKLARYLDERFGPPEGFRTVRKRYQPSDFIAPPSKAAKMGRR